MLREPALDDAHERLGQAGVELRARAATELLDRVGVRRRGAVAARRDHRVIRVAERDDAGAERDLVACEAVRVAAAVEALVARADEAADRPSDGASPRIRSPISEWLRMNSSSASSSGPGLSRIESGIASLPTSCRVAAWRICSHSRLGQRERRGELAREIGDVGAVLAQAAPALLPWRAAACRSPAPVLRAPAGALVRVHALIGEPHRVGQARGLVGDDGGAVRAP